MYHKFLVKRELVDTILERGDCLDMAIAGAAIRYEDANTSHGQTLMSPHWSALRALQKNTRLSMIDSTLNQEVIKEGKRLGWI
jgi:hypothetical protein